MANAATVKDVLYALEFLGERLCRWPTLKPGGKSAWALEPSGRKVPESVANTVRSSSQVTTVPSSRYGEVSYVWKAAA